MQQIPATPSQHVAKQTESTLEVAPNVAIAEVYAAHEIFSLPRGTRYWLVTCHSMPLKTHCRTLPPQTSNTISSRTVSFLFEKIWIRRRAQWKGFAKSSETMRIPDPSVNNSTTAIICTARSFVGTTTTARNLSTARFRKLSKMVLRIPKFFHFLSVTLLQHRPNVGLVMQALSVKLLRFAWRKDWSPCHNVFWAPPLSLQKYELAYHRVLHHETELQECRYLGKRPCCHPMAQARRQIVPIGVYSFSQLGTQPTRALPRRTSESCRRAI